MTNKETLLGRLFKEGKITWDEMMILMDKPLSFDFIPPYNPYPYSPSVPWITPPVFPDTPYYPYSGGTSSPTTVTYNITCQR